jgi:hypothetical protein
MSRMVNNMMKNLILDKIDNSTNDMTEVYKYGIILVHRFNTEQLNNVLTSRCCIDATNIFAKKHPRSDARKVDFLRMRSLLSSDENGNPIRFCTGCDQWIPATEEFFNKKTGGTLQSRCKVCRAKKRTDYIKLDSKQCHGCNETFPATEQYFPKDKTTTDGFRNFCKTCANAKGREHYDENHRKRPRVKKGYKHCYGCNRTFPETEEYFHKGGNSKNGLVGNCKECVNKRSKAYYDNNTEHVLEMSKQYYRDNPEKVNERHKKYNKTEIGKIVRSAIDNRRRARKIEAPGTLTAEQIQQKLKAQKHRCYYCFKKFEKSDGKYIFHLEHTVPLSRPEEGPRHDVNFTVLACPSCNHSKSDKCPWEWVQGGRLF